MSTDHAQELIAAMRDHRDAVFSADYELGDLANAAAMLGQDRLAMRLTAIAKALSTTADRLNGAVGGSIHGRLIEAEQATANVIAAAFAGMSIASETKPFQRKGER